MEKLAGKIGLSWRHGELLSGILLVAALGCAALPSVGPLVDASNQLRSAVETSGAAVETELRLMSGGASQADQLHRQWKARNEAFAALTAYAHSLQDIIAAGESGAATAEKIADSVAALAKGAGVALPGSPEAVSVVTDAAKFISAQIAIARAAKSLEQSLVAAQPAVDEICRLIASDLHDLDDIFVAAATATDDAIRAEYGDVIGYRRRLLKQLSGSDPAHPGNEGTQANLAQALQGTDGVYAEYLARRKEIADRLRAGRALIQAAAQSANEWSVAHGNLVTAMKERRPVNVDSLVNAAVEIQKLVNRVREL
ncbi:MAG TPA: hypothetical protein VGR78_15120 [Verrucomicrobiae bacterium]|nr:hypothetical protein [Verrucomicrobiae bacterium]